MDENIKVRIRSQHIYTDILKHLFQKKHSENLLISRSAKKVFILLRYKDNNFFDFLEVGFNEDYNISLNNLNNGRIYVCKCGRTNAKTIRIDEIICEVEQSIMGIDNEFI